MNHHLDSLVSAFENAVRGETLLTLSEGLIKVRCIEAGLSLGWTAQEGAGRTPNGDVADFATQNGRAIEWVRRPRIHKLPVGSCDVTFVDPILMGIEIKARPDFGTKSQAQFQEMRCDIERIASTPELAFFFVFDPKIYRSFSDEKKETRGRSASECAKWFHSSFPKLDDVTSKESIELKTSYAGQTLLLSFRTLRTPGNSGGVLAVGSRLDSTFEQST